MNPIEIAFILLTITLGSGAGLMFYVQKKTAQKNATLWLDEKNTLNQQNLLLQNRLDDMTQSCHQAQTEQTRVQAHLQNSTEQLNASQSQLKQTQTHLQQHQLQLRQLNGELKHTQATLSERQQDQLHLAQKEKILSDVNSELNDLKSQLKQEQLARQKDEENLQDKLSMLTQNKAQLSQEFENLSNKIFNEKQKQFSQSSQAGLNSLLTPFKDQLEGLCKKVDDVYVNDSKDRASLKAQIGELHNLNKQITHEAASLARALRGDKKTQGNWGELVLETVLEKSGLRQGEEFVREKSITNEEGDRLRPDVIINLPEGKHIVVDAKVSLNAYNDYINASGETEKAAHLKAHIEAVRFHIKSLAKKSYARLPGINSPDFVFLFMPVEPAFMVAFEHDDELFNDAFEQRIVVVTPTTLLASLRTVASLWSIERQNKNARQLAEQAAKVHDKLVGFVESMEKVGIQLNTVQGTYDKAWSQLKEGRGNLISQAHKFKDLGVRLKKDMPKQVTESAELEF